MLELKNICWNAPDGKEVLKNINLTIKDNLLVAISGPNGSGKTTLAKILMGIEQPTSGTIIYNGKDITNYNVTQRANLGISFGFQQPVSFKGITVKHMLRLAARKNLEEDELKEILHKVGLCALDYINRDIDDTLSGGEMKRIEIASVLARNTSFTIFDEPEAGIDLWSFANLIEVFDEIRNDRNRTLVVISHQERILNIADEIVLIKDGKVSDIGPGAEILKKMTESKGVVTHQCGKMEAVYG